MPHPSRIVGFQRALDRGENLLDVLFKVTTII
jgi:hypothetical protein